MCALSNAAEDRPRVHALHVRLWFNAEAPTKEVGGQHNRPDVDGELKCSKRRVACTSEGSRGTGSGSQKMRVDQQGDRFYFFRSKEAGPLRV